MRQSFVAVAVGFLVLAGCNKQSTEAPAPDKVPATTSGPILASLTAAPLDKAAALKVMHERHEGMEQVGKTTKNLKRSIESEPADMAAVKSGAAAMNKLAQAASGWFAAGTGPELGKTGAKPEIWQKPQDFSAKLKTFQAKAAAFNAAAQRGDPASVKTAFADLGKTCKACHDTYRKDMHH